MWNTVPNNLSITLITPSLGILWGEGQLVDASARPERQRTGNGDDVPRQVQAHVLVSSAKFKQWGWPSLQGGLLIINFPRSILLHKTEYSTLFHNEILRWGNSKYIVQSIFQRRTCKEGGKEARLTVNRCRHPRSSTWGVGSWAGPRKAHHVEWSCPTTPPEDVIPALSLLGTFLVTNI